MEMERNEREKERERVNFRGKRQKFRRRWTFKAFDIKVGETISLSVLRHLTRDDAVRAGLRRREGGWEGGERGWRSERRVDCSGGSSELLKEKLYKRPPREKGNFHIIIRSSNYSNKRVWLTRISAGYFPPPSRASFALHLRCFAAARRPTG